VTSLPFALEDPFMNRFLEQMAKYMTIVFYDKHGCGHSDRDRKIFTLETEVLDLETVTDHLGLVKFNFVCKEESTVIDDDINELSNRESEIVEQATIVFTEIVSSTALVTKVGDAAARDLFVKHDKIVRNELKTYGGKELQNLGDGFMLSFVSASAAIKCAGQIQEQMSEALPSIQVRIGINTGEVVIRESRHPFGQAVFVASRIVSQCKGGQILVSDVTRQLTAGSGFSFVERGTFQPKGFNESVKLFEVSWRK